MVSSRDSQLSSESYDQRTQSHRTSQIAMNEQEGSSRARSCITCRQRKVKCDKLLPCTGCRNSQFECVYPPPKPPGVRAKPVTNQRLRDRLEKLENLVHDLQGDPASKAVANQESHNIEKYNAKFPIPDLGRLVIKEGQCRYVENSFWVSLTNEVAGIRDLLDEDERGVDGSPGLRTQYHDGDDGYLVSSSPFAIELGQFHPQPNQTSLLWQIFKKNVDPIIRILHKPSIFVQITSVRDGAIVMTRPFEALLFAIYFAAVTSMTQEQCRASLEMDKVSLLKRYRFAFQNALARANLLSIHNIVVLQALVIFLICELNHDDTRLVWTSTAVAIRIAQSLGLHRDGSKLGLSFFESEIRRRIWWQICILDIRTAENHGSDPSVAHKILDTAIPLNINDDDFDPNSTTLPLSIEGITEMTLSLVRYEIISGLGKTKLSLLDINLCNAEADRITKECNDRLQIQYLRHCDLNIPFHWFIATFARMMMAKMWINIHHRFQLSGRVKVLPDSCKDRIFTTSLEVLELCLLLEREESTKQWRWALRNYIPWQAMVFLLCQICQREKSELVDRAWTNVQDAFMVWGNVAANKRQDVLWANMNKLMAKAHSSRGVKVSGPVDSQPLTPSLDTVNESAAGSEMALSNDGMALDMASNVTSESWLGFDPQLEGQQWWYDDFGDSDNWLTGNWSGFN